MASTPTMDNVFDYTQERIQMVWNEEAGAWKQEVRADKEASGLLSKIREYQQYPENLVTPAPDNVWERFNRSTQIFKTLARETRDLASGSRPNHSSGSSSATTTIYEIPIVISNFRDPQVGHHQVSALGDYCAKFNFIREDYASRQGLLIDRKHTTSVKIGSGKRITTIGTTSLPLFRFKDESTFYSPLFNVFHVIPKCLHNIILGRSFLKMTNTFSTLTNFIRRVKKRVVHGITHHHLLYLGDSVPRFSGLINGKPHQALADSGAKVLVMDEGFARDHGLAIDREIKNRTRLRFADGSTADTSGIVHGVQWEFGFGGDQIHELDFHVLPNAPADVILSDHFLFSTNAFSEYNCYLVDDDDEEADEDDDAFFFAIDIDKRHDGPGLLIAKSASQDRYIELVRRGEADDEISRLPMNEQAAARAREDERRTRWDRNFTQSRQSSVQNPSIGSSTPLSSMNPSSADSQRPPPVSSPRKNSFRWFKLKWKGSPSP